MSAPVYIVSGKNFDLPFNHYFVAFGVAHRLAEETNSNTVLYELRHNAWREVRIVTPHKRREVVSVAGRQ